MATRIEEILGKDINSLKELREEIKRLQDSIANVDPTTQQFKDTTTKLAAAQEQLTSVTRGSKDGIDVAKDSIVGMEREYKNLYNTYKMLTEEQRNSDFGKEMASSLDTLSNKLNETKKQVGNYKDNIGRYTDSIIDAFGKMGGSLGALAGPLKTATSGIKGLNTALKANPIMAVVGAIQLMITVVNKMKGAIQQNEELQMRWNEAMSAFKPIADAMANAVQKIAEQFVKFIEKIADAIRWIREAKAAVTDFLGITKGAKKAVQEQNKVYQDIAKSQNQLILNKREYQKLNAQDKAIVEQLREEASETTNLQEKKELLEQAKEKQAEIDARNLELAQEELRILEEQSKLTANSAADNEKLAAAVAAVSEAEAQAAANARNFNKQLASIEKSLGGGSGGGGGVTGAVKGTGKALDEMKEKAKKTYEELIQWSKTAEQRLTEEYQENLRLFKKYHLDTTLLTKKYNDELAKLQQEARDKERQNYLSYINDKTTWARTEYEESAKARGVAEENIQLGLLDMLEKDFFKFKNRIIDISEETDLTAEKMLEKMKEVVEEANAAGFDLKFPPENWEKGADFALERFMKYIENYGKNINDAFWQQVSEVDKAKLERFDREIEEKIAQSLRNTLYSNVISETGAILANMTDSGLQQLIIGNQRQYLEAEKEVYEKALEDFKGSEDKKLEIKQRYYETLTELRNMDLEAEAAYIEKTNQMWEDALTAYESIGNAITTVTNAISNLIQAQINDGKITKEQAEKKKKTLIALEKVALAVNIAQIAASTAAGIMDVWKGYATETASNAVAAAASGPAAPATLAALNTKSLASAILKTTGLATMGAANIAAATMGTISKVQSIKGSEGGGSAEVSPVANVAEIDSTPYTYSRQLQTAEEYDNTYNKEYYVSVTDINNVQNRVKVRENESSF